MKAKSYMDAGGLVPDEITIGMLLDRIHEEDCKTDTYWTDFQGPSHRLRALQRPWATWARPLTMQSTWMFLMRTS